MAGRPTKYKEEYCETIIEYFNRKRYDIKEEVQYGKGGQIIGTKEIKEPVSPATLYGFAASIGVCHDTLLEWKTRHPDFSVAIKKAKSLQADHIVNNAMEGVCPNAFAIFMMKNNFKWTDRVEQKVEGNLKLENIVSASFDEEGKEFEGDNTNE